MKRLAEWAGRVEMSTTELLRRYLGTKVLRCVATYLILAYLIATQIFLKESIAPETPPPPASVVLSPILSRSNLTSEQLAAPDLFTNPKGSLLGA